MRGVLSDMELRPHQKRILDENPSKAILNWEMRVGKSLPAAIWLTRKAGERIVVTPKQNKKDWQKIVGPDVAVMSKEEFKKIAHALNPTAMVVDEAHYFASALFARKGKGRSQMAAGLYGVVQRNPEMHILLLTATPIRQDAWSLHTLLCYVGVYHDWKAWQNEFFSKEARPFLPRQPWMKHGEMPTAWMPKPDWRIRIRPYVEKYTDIVSLRDIIKDLPDAEPIVVKVPAGKYEKPKDEIVTWMNEHQWEQKKKAQYILEMGFKKLIVVAHYTKQIDELKAVLEKEKPVFVLDGRTKDADAVKTAAQEAEECYFIVQSSMGFGFDGWMFGAIVFASMSHSNVHHTQMTGRSRHIEHIRPVFHYYLIGGRWDQRIYDSIKKGEDFNPHIYQHDGIGSDTTGSDETAEAERG